MEAITEEAEKRDIERFQPLLAGMNNNNIPLKVHTQMQKKHNLIIGSLVIYLFTYLLTYLQLIT